LTGVPRCDGHARLRRHVRQPLPAAAVLLFDYVIGVPDLCYRVWLGPRGTDVPAHRAGRGRQPAVSAKDRAGFHTPGREDIARFYQLTYNM
jgi:hypothetical protein